MKENIMNSTNKYKDRKCSHFISGSSSSGSSTSLSSEPQMRFPRSSLSLKLVKPMTPMFEPLFLTLSINYKDTSTFTFREGPG